MRLSKIWAMRRCLICRRPAGDEHRFVRGAAAVFSRRVDRRAGGEWNGERSGCLRRGAEVSERELHFGRGISAGATGGDCGGDGGAAATAGVQIVTGDTKVVERGHGDGCYINYSGRGRAAAGDSSGPQRAQAGDAVLVSGTIGDHGMAIMSVREGLEFESPIRSDCAALNGMIAEVLDAVGGAVHAMRDPTRGGLASTLNEIAQASGVGIVIDEARLPVRTEVQSACELLGLDPVYVANEGKAVFFVAPEAAEQVLAVLRAHPLGRDAARIGQVTAEHKRMLVARTAMGANRVIATQIGEQLPRIC